jgi:hypothetical protein
MRQRAADKAEREALLQWIPGYMSKAEARRLGLATYFTGKPCRNGHVAPRHTRGGCTVCVREYNKEWKRADRQRNPDRYRARDRGRVLSEEQKRRQAARCAERKDELRIYYREYSAARVKVDDQYRLTRNLRSRVLAALSKQSAVKVHRTHDLIGCTVPDLMSHIEARFAEGMTWENHGRYGWHIDHIRPCASFDLTDPEQQRQCFHYTNLQPLWAADNIRKGTSMPQAV